MVDGRKNGKGSTSRFGNVGEPSNDTENTFEIVGGGEMGNTVLVHDLSSSELQVGRVDFTTENLVERSGTSKDDGLSFDLNGTLTETNEVSSNTD